MSQVTAPAQSIGSFAREIIAKNPQAPNQEVLDQVKAQFPQAKTSIACIAWYKSNMKKTKTLTIVPKPRTLELIDDEIVTAQLKVVALQEERELMLAEQREEMEAEFARLSALLGKSDLPPTQG